MGEFTRQRHCLYSKPRRALIILRENNCLCGKHCGLPGLYQDRCRPHKKIFTHVGLSAHAHNIVQEVEVHGWLLSGIEELTIYFAALFGLL